MTRTLANISKRMLFVYCMLAGFIFLLFLPMGMTGNLQLLYWNIFRGPLSLCRETTVNVRTAATTQDPLTQENERLRVENRLLANKYANIESQLQTTQQRIDELAGLRTRSEWSGMGFLTAGVVTDPATGQNELIIARGRDDGVARGQYVMGELSIIGMVTDVAANTARVRLITDPKCSIPVQIADTDVRGIMVGRGDGTAGIARVRNRQSVKVDSLVLAQIPAGVPIVTAKVTECKRSVKEPLVGDVSVKPACDIVNLKSVIVIVPRK